MTMGKEQEDGLRAVAAMQRDGEVEVRRHVALAAKRLPGIPKADPVVVEALRALAGRTVDIETTEAWQEATGVVVGKLGRQNFGNGVWGALLVELWDTDGEYLHGQPVWMIVRITPRGEA